MFCLVGPLEIYFLFFIFFLEIRKSQKQISLPAQFQKIKSKTSYKDHGKK